MTSQNIAKGIMVAFDVFSKKDMVTVNTRIAKTFEVESETLKSAFFGGSSETNTSVWKIELSETFFEALKKTCDEKGFTFNTDLMKKYIENFQVWGYDSPNLPFYIIMVRVQIKKEALNSAENLRTELLQIGSAASLFIESLGGYRKAMTNFSPSSPIVTQLWIKVNKSELDKMRKIEQTLIEKKDELSLSQRKELSQKLRNLEPVELSAPVGDVHSHILFAANVTFVVGHMTQLALGGIMTPFIEYLSYDENLLQQDFHEPPLGPAELLIGGGITRSEYANLIGLISLLIYLNHLAVEREHIDIGVSKLRDDITSKNAKDKIEKYLLELNELGTQISSLQQITGRFSRYWERPLRGISEGRDIFALEIPIENTEPFSLFNLEKGYLGTLADEILAALENLAQFLEKQGLEASALRTYISDIVNLRISKNAEVLQKRMKILAEISISVAIISLIISVVNWVLLLL